MKVLIADDKQTWHKLFEIVLSLRGIDVVHAYSPKEAISKAASERPDVALIDVSLSGGTAYDVIKDVKELGVPVVVMGYSVEGLNAEKAKSLGAYEILEKPFTVEELLSILRKIKAEGVKPEEKAPELVLPTEEELPVINLEETPVETIELEEEGATLEALPVEEASLPTEEKKESLPQVKEEVVEKVAEPVSKAVSKELNLPQEKIEEIVREIAWEVIPEIAEKVIREEVEKLIKSRLA
ncbi:response regulator [Thermovibrio sp.]